MRGNLPIFLFSNGLIGPIESAIMTAVSRNISYNQHREIDRFSRNNVVI
jgi:hypothetical protein